MVVLLPMMFVLMYMMLRPNLKHRFQIELEHVEWNGKRITAMTIFLLAVVCWITSTFISDALGGVKDLDTIIAMSAAILIGVTGVASWSQIQKYRVGRIDAVWWWFNTQRNFKFFWGK